MRAVLRLRLSAAELRGQLVVLLLALWSVTVVNWATPTWTMRSGQIKGTDFVHFHSLARLAAAGEIADFGDPGAVRRAQLAALPQSADAWFPPVYGPLISAVLSPLGFLSYGVALGVWIGCLVAAYFWSVAQVLWSSALLRRHAKTVLIGAAAFPPFYQLIQHGQLSAIALVAIVCSWRALDRKRPVLAGALLGILAYKPSLFGPVVLVLTAAGAWKLLLGAAVTVLAQVAATLALVGTDGLVRFVGLFRDLLGLASALAAKPEQMHSLRSLWMLLVPSASVALLLYALTAVAAVSLAAIVWRRSSVPAIQYSALILATVLAAPHMYVYDLVILAPVWLWLVEWFLSSPVSPNVGRLLYAGYVAPLAAPFVTLLRVQPSVICYAVLLAVTWRTTHRSAAPFTEIALRKDSADTTP